MAHHPQARPSKTSGASWDGKVTHRRTGITEQPLAVRLAALLSNHGHVPQSKHGDCLRDLREVVRARIKGAHDGRWSKADPARRAHSAWRLAGALAPHRDIYVRPRSLRVTVRLPTPLWVPAPGAS